ncbi:hypothetical protein [Aquipuribacter hungaricus]|uniref:Uncharacterized protein n=2 Tax=Aquipuribacter hungaricus TaxID=545624 RepID=A0ABV7WLM5_9MICO
MSRERARRREAREQVAATARERAETRRLAEVRRARARAGRARAVRALGGARPVDPRLRAARARLWSPVLAALVAAHAVVWLLTDDPALRATAVGVTALAAPVVWVLVTDSARGRRSGYRRRP